MIDTFKVYFTQQIDLYYASQVETMAKEDSTQVSLRAFYSRCRPLTSPMLLIHGQRLAE